MDTTNKQVQEATAREIWFDMFATEITPTIKRVLQLRNVLDPKRDYRESAKPCKVLSGILGVIELT
jgi:hypothetical protein